MGQTGGQTDRQTDARPLHRPCHIIMRAVSRIFHQISVDWNRLLSRQSCSAIIGLNGIRAYLQNSATAYYMIRKGRPPFIKFKRPSSPTSAQWTRLVSTIMTPAASSGKRLCVGLVSVCPSVCLSHLSIDICRRQRAAAASVLHCDPPIGTRINTQTCSINF